MRHLVKGWSTAKQVVSTSGTASKTLHTSSVLLRSSRLDEDDVKAVDPFLAKLQHKTEADYLELLSRQDTKSGVPDDEDEAREEEIIEV